MEMHAASPLGGLEDYLHGLLRALPHTLACIDDFYYEEDIDADQGQLWRERSEAQAPDQTESKAPDESHVDESPHAAPAAHGALPGELAAMPIDAPDQSQVVESPRAPGRQLDELAAELVPVEAPDQSHVVESPRAPGKQLDELAAELVPVEAVTAACHAVRSAALRYHKSPQKLPSGQVDKSDSASRACRLTGRAAPERLWEKPWPSGRANLHEPRVGGAAIGREVPKRIAAKLPARVACEHQAWGLHRVFPECGHVPMMAMLPAYAQPSRDRDRRGFAGPRSASTSRCQGASARLQLPPLSVREGRGASTTPGFCLRRRAFDA
ncbi:unnamed protein product [Effrenium voratum]|uniref:Uncharacterized protein n=1 Tax=Effrenium voratum TaxID=2562239 RepID=A0AA36JNM0_9DINO|nr:unnamed protein product [Effrenium voratum]